MLDFHCLLAFLRRCRASIVPSIVTSELLVLASLAVVYSLRGERGSRLFSVF